MSGDCPELDPDDHADRWAPMAVWCPEWCECPVCRPPCERCGGVRARGDDDDLCADCARGRDDEDETVVGRQRALGAAYARMRMAEAARADDERVKPCSC